MRRSTSLTKRAVILAGMALVFAASAAAQQPRLTNAKLESRPAAGDLKGAENSIVAAQESPAWLGYAVPMLAGDEQMCCGTWTDSSGAHCNGCTLERDGGGVNISSDRSGSASGAGPVKLEGPRYLFVLLRVEHKTVGKIRAFSEDCPLDAGGLPFYWLGEAKPEQSVALLSGYVSSAKDDDRDTQRLADGAITAIVFHADASADRALESFVAPSQPEWLRRKTSFWLGNARGHAGYLVLKRMAENDPSDRVRDQVTFALSQSRDPQAVDEMIHMAKDDSSQRVRGQALFWLGQKAGKKAVGALTDAIENDPDTEIKKKAVFALSQLPKDEGVPMLIEVAKNNKNSAVRKQAMFWLGQSQDPRALSFFEQILTH